MGIAEILGMSEREYDEMSERLSKELLGIYREGMERGEVVYMADKLLRWLDEGDETERLVKAILLVKREEELQNLRDFVRGTAARLSEVNGMMVKLMTVYPWLFVKQEVW